MKKAIVVGATSGIGRKLAEILADNGYMVGITGRRGELLNEISTQKPHVFRTMVMDVNDTTTSISKLKALVDELGGLDLLVLSSGIGERNNRLDYEIEQAIVQTNVVGYTCIIDWAFNLFAAKKSGHLVGISSIAGLRGGQVGPAYGATKAYQINYLEALRLRSARKKLGVTVTDIRPGFVDTAIIGGGKVFWMASTDKAGLQIYRAIKKKCKVAYITRRWILVAWLLKLVPRFIYDRA
ncbi:MAG TPA: SDR family NAD(P)-dependent oxidoreductase [Saprospiraceae bacterium]|jgi:short-subunit dehydrogenase|nr:MAG: oxidoreductase [Candidatus Parvibacillus calidus]MBX2937159.1 SDR family NAD(P)-dependent oxidoreductase [Saprospiraceae bacterium]MBK7741263.1 SDR family NAD(P)-dependent oxidoreductase [Candidatus Parvibacillus calidus]MBX7178616.1 SDR family NAD(P)-dependent oxidoreductase [Saprospiraceae bacterium]MCB0590715.1 SDR family NAD(P)-dependent oxidoreductase [Saprospiraceae bacterium]